MFENNKIYTDTDKSNWAVLEVLFLLTDVYYAGICGGGYYMEESNIDVLI